MTLMEHLVLPVTDMPLVLAAKEVECPRCYGVMRHSHDTWTKQVFVCFGCNVTKTV